MNLIFNNVDFSFDAVELFCSLQLHLSRGWSGVVGANGSGKTTLLKLATGHLEPLSGSITAPASTLYCQQRTDDPPALLAELLCAPDHVAARLSGLLELQPDWPERWHSLSHGERKRAQIGVALWQQPDVLAIDEPTNHLDAAARKLLLRALQSYAGIGLLVSHDRDLLDTLCQSCIFVEPPAAILRPGNYSAGREQAALEELSLGRERQQLKVELGRLTRETNRRKAAAARSDSRVSKRGLRAKDHDAKAKIDHARLSGKDATDGRKFKQMQARLGRAQDRLSQTKVRKTYEQGIWVAGSCSRRTNLFRLPAQAISLGPAKTLHIPDLSMRPTERIALSGENGSGKSTLIRHIIGQLADCTYLPQEISLAESRAVLKRVSGLAGAEKGQLMTIVSRLGSRPQRLLESTTPSPGEIRKLLLAIGIMQGPELIVMDEPTNHLDLVSIECLEEALNEAPCGLLFVSHDRRFIGKLAAKEWRIDRTGPRDYLLDVTRRL